MVKDHKEMAEEGPGVQGQKAEMAQIH